MTERWGVEMTQRTAVTPTQDAMENARKEFQELIAEIMPLTDEAMAIVQRGLKENPYKPELLEQKYLLSLLQLSYQRWADERIRNSSR
jgi:hypothetical protein